MYPEKDWLKLDTAAKIYPSISETHNNTTFRLEIELYEDIDPALLQQALVVVLPRFPSFGVTLKRGLFWYYLDTNELLPAVKQDSGFPCRRLKDFVNNGYLFNVLYYKKNVILECFHALTDGTGAIEFIKTLLFEYFMLKGYETDPEGLVIPPHEDPKAKEIENSFLKYYDAHGAYTKLRQTRAYHIVGSPLKDNEVFITHGILPLGEVLAAVKKRGVTVSAYIAALLIYCIYNNQPIQKHEKRPIIISVPIDLRSMFNSKTLRNFISFANVGMLVKPDMTFEDILNDISRQ